MEPISSYYRKGNAFYLKSKWPRRVRIVVSLLFLGFSALFATNESYSYYSFSEKKQDQIEAIASLPGVEMKDAKQILTSTFKWAEEFKVDKKLILAVAKVESAYNKHAISPSGAYGLMQVIPLWHKDKILTAKTRLGNPELFNIDTNIYLGTWVLRDCLVKFKNVEKALDCYSGGNHLINPDYVQRVMTAYKGIKI